MHRSARTRVPAALVLFVSAITITIAIAITITIAFVVVAGASPSFGQTLDERKPGFFGKVVDEAGKPVIGVIVVVSPKRDMAGGLEVKTSERGFTYPRLPEPVAQYYVRIKSDEWFIYKFKLRSRGGDMRIVQDIAGSLTPELQDKMPPLNWRSGNAVAEFTLVKIADYKATQAAPATAQPAGPTLDEQVQELVALGDYKGASDKLAEAVAAAPDDVDKRWQLAMLLGQAGEPAEALKEGRKVLAAQPQRTGARPYLADWLTDIGQDAEALQLLEKERELDPQNALVYKKLARAYHDAGEKDRELAAIEQWRTVAPDDIEAAMALASARAAAGDFAAAEKLYREVAQKDPATAPRSFYNVGVSIFNQKGDMNAAAGALEQAVALKPDYAKAYEMLGYVRLNQGKVAEARAAFEKFLELAPNDPAAGDIKKTVQALGK